MTNPIRREVCSNKIFGYFRHCLIFLRRQLSLSTVCGCFHLTPSEITRWQAVTLRTTHVLNRPVLGQLGHILRVAVFGRVNVTVLNHSRSGCTYETSPSSHLLHETKTTLQNLKFQINLEAFLFPQVAGLNLVVELNQRFVESTRGKVRRLIQEVDFSSWYNKITYSWLNDNFCGCKYIEGPSFFTDVINWDLFTALCTHSMLFLLYSTFCREQV